MAFIHLSVLTPANRGSAICSTALPRGHLNTSTVMDRLQHLEQLHLSSSRDGLASVIDGRVIFRGSIKAGDLWQAIACSSQTTLPVTPDSMPISPWTLDVARFTVKILDGGNINISIASRSVAELQIIPNFMVLYSVTVTVGVRLDTISQENGLISLSAEGTWRPGRSINWIPVYAEWLGSSFNLSFSEIAALDVSSFLSLRSVDDPVWNSVRSVASSFGLQTIADISMSAQVTNINGRNMVMLFSATGQTMVGYFGMFATRLVIVYPFLTKSKSKRSTHVIISRTSTLQTVNHTPTGGAKHRGVTDAWLLSLESMSSSSHDVSQTAKHRKLKRRSVTKRSTGAAGTDSVECFNLYLD